MTRLMRVSDISTYDPEEFKGSLRFLTRRQRRMTLKKIRLLIDHLTQLYELTTQMGISLELTLGEEQYHDLWIDAGKNSVLSSDRPTWTDTKFHKLFTRPDIQKYYKKATEKARKDTP